MKLHAKLLLLALILLPVAASAKVSITSLKVENMTNPLGIDTQRPRFSWQIVSDKNNTQQTSYRILVASTPEKLANNEGDLWDSGTVGSDSQLWITYAGKTLRKNQHAFWKVLVGTNKGKSDWSEPAKFSVGLLMESQWSGRWIGVDTLQADEHRGMHPKVAARLLRKEVNLKGKVARATAYVAGLGLYQFYVNGQKQGGNAMLQPTPTDYRKSILYNTYDITTLLLQDTVATLAIELGNGHFFPPRQEKSYKAPVFGLPKCRINVIVEYTNGRTQTIATDDSWRISTDGPIRSNNEYDGEIYDARKEIKGWTKADFDDANWRTAQRVAIPDGQLKAQMQPPMVAKEYGMPKTSSRHGSKLILDFGQNMAGFVAFRPFGQRGDTIKVRYAERLNADGSIYTANLRNAKSEDIYICNGKEDGQWWQPTFVYHGFRYAEVSGMNAATMRDFKAFTVDDEMESTGTFACSDSVLNQVVRNAWWGIKSNYKGVPVDCPQRNERQPWLGDRTVGSLGESFLFNNERLYSQWMRDIAEGMRSDGVISSVTPSFWNYYEENMTWPAAFPFTCDMLYSQFGNEQPLRESYPAIKKWLNHMLNECTSDGIITKDKYGDWCVPPEKLELVHSQDPNRQTDGKLLSTAYGVEVLRLMSKFARLQGLDSEAQHWDSLRTDMTDAFNRTFLTVKRGTSPRPGHVLYPDSVFYGNNTATANLLPLAFGMVPDSVRTDVVNNVVTNIITTGGGHVTCGVIGISWLLRGLSDNGFADVAYLLATNDSYPSWGYMASQGATTVWELWNGDKANPSMNSGNHVMLLGDLLTWVYQYLGGIRQAPESVGYKHIVLKPSFEIEDCFGANTTFHSPYGPITSNWKKNLQHVSWQVSIPANTTADVYLPNGEVRHIGSGSYTFESDIPTSNPAIVKDQFVYENTYFPQAHASTITELPNGDLLAAYFGGTREKNPDVCIWVSRKAKGSDTWQNPQLAADGVFSLDDSDASLAGLSGINESTTTAFAGPIRDMPAYIFDYYDKPDSAQLARISAKNPKLKRKACWNPVLFTMPDGTIYLFYKVGSSVGDWQGCYVTSTDQGKTWSKRVMLPKNFIGPVKNKPELIDGKLICPSSTEGKWWTFHVEIFDPQSGQWKFVGPVPADSALLTDDGKMHPIKCIQPSILKLADGRLQVLMRTHNGFLGTSFSSDNGQTWTPVTLSKVENNQSGTDAVTMKDGRHVLIYNNFETIMGTPKGVRTPLSTALSTDGTNWKHWLTLEDSPISQYSYPAIIQGSNGHLYCTYTWRRQRIAFKELVPPKK